MALIPTLWCRACHTGFALVLKVETCPACQQPAQWATESPVPLHPFRLTRDDADWLKACRIAVSAEDVSV